MSLPLVPRDSDPAGVWEDVPLPLIQPPATGSRLSLSQRNSLSATCNVSQRFLCSARLISNPDSTVWCILGETFFPKEFKEDCNPEIHQWMCQIKWLPSGSTPSFMIWMRFQNNTTLKAVSQSTASYRSQWDIASQRLHLIGQGPTHSEPTAFLLREGEGVGATVDWLPLRREAGPNSSSNVVKTVGEMVQEAGRMGVEMVCAPPPPS